MSRTDQINCPNQIRRFRKQRSLRLRDIARLVGIINYSHVTRWESGDRTPTLETALKLSASLNCPVEILFKEQFTRLREEVRERQQRHNIIIEY